MILFISQKKEISSPVLAICSFTQSADKSFGITLLSLSVITISTSHPWVSIEGYLFMHVLLNWFHNLAPVFFRPVPSTIHSLFCHRPSILPFFSSSGPQFNIFLYSALNSTFFLLVSPPLIPYPSCGLPHGEEKRLRPGSKGWISYPDCGYPHSEQSLCSYRRSIPRSGHINRARLYFLSALNSTFFLLSALNSTFFSPAAL